MQNFYSYYCIIEFPSCCGEVSMHKTISIELSGSYTTFIIELLFKYKVSINNPSKANQYYCLSLSCQNVLLIMDIYTCCWSTFLINKPIICQDAKEKHSSLYYLKDALIRFSSLLFLDYIIVSKLKANISPTKSQFYYI